jgi:hypothetical protein|tara:strand:- start:357 stop:608 length:252 start_codon:yes stop_codon:yes gene_type:complete
MLYNLDSNNRGGMKMNRYEIVVRELYSEPTPEYGMGDYPEIRLVCVDVVSAETSRKAQNVAKKARPGLRFGGNFGARCIKVEN